MAEQAAWYHTPCTECDTPVVVAESSRWVIERYGERCPPCSDRLAHERMRLERNERERKQLAEVEGVTRFVGNAP